jgi:nitrite reductase/ring-hydroxylating ferredoxin subunit
MMKYDVAEIGEIERGKCKIVNIKGRSIGVYYNGKDYFAIRNICPHQQAELCKGTFTGTTLVSKPHEYIYGREGEVLVCPWHGWEYDVKTGQSLVDPNRYRIKVYDVSIENKRVMVHL